jgi:acyl carrier protein
MLNMENFESSISEILEVDEVNSNDEFDSFESWDSMTILSIIAFCHEEYGTIMEADEIKNSKTIVGLRELIKSKMEHFNSEK